ncbi:hypothetical protein ACQPYK_44485 [Streptosporangium sp. CA-135522]|uniref:nSTAND1 domain-containing NTPase n=1 Tax=Streptosporangium sp. CA-135522 TaxID=3240072 RepID=UPI003D8E8874
MAVEESPYVGLRAFDDGDQERFFGRTEESRTLAALWLRNRLVILHGPSGVGKTSLIRAGALPVLDAAADLLPVGRASHASAFPLAALPRHNPYTLALLSTWSPEESPIRLSRLTISEFLRTRPVRKDAHGAPLPVLAAIDQFEEVPDDPTSRSVHQEDFRSQLSEAVKEFPNLRLLISITDGRLSAVLPLETDLAGHDRARLHLRPLNAEAAIEAVAGPPRDSGWSLAPEVAQSLVESLHGARWETTSAGAWGGGAGIEPWRLQVVCSELWRRLPADVDVIAPGHLRAFADAGRVLERFYRRTIHAVARDYGVTEEQLREWLERAFPADSAPRGEVREPYRAGGGLPPSLARVLERRHILRARPEGDAWRYELQDELLATVIRQPNRPWPADDVPSADEDGTGPADSLRAAEDAMVDGELLVARRHAAEAVRLCGHDEIRLQAEAQSMLGNIAFLRELLGEAEECYQRAAQLFEMLQSHVAVARLLAAIGRLLLIRGEYAKAIVKLGAAVRRLDGDLSLRSELARALWGAGDLWPAAAEFGRVLTVVPNEPEALAGRGQILAERGDHRGALQDLSRLDRSRPDVAARPEVRAARALALAHVGRTTEAAEEIDHAVAAAPSNGPVLLRAAEVAARSQQPGRAVSLLRRALHASDPTLFPHQFGHARSMLLRLESHGSAE